MKDQNPNILPYRDPSEIDDTLPSQFGEVLGEVLDRMVEVEEGTEVPIGQPLTPDQQELKDVEEELIAIERERAEIESRIESGDETHDDLHRRDQLKIQRLHYDSQRADIIDRIQNPPR